MGKLMTPTQDFLNKVYDDFLSIPERTKNVLDGIPKGIGKVFKGPNSGYKLAYSYVESKINDHDCYVGVKLIEKKVYRYNTFIHNINPFTPKELKNPELRHVTVMFDHTYSKSENCLPQLPQYDDDNDNEVPDYPNDTPDIAIFIEVNRVVSWTDYFREFACHYAESVKIAFNNIEITPDDRINYTVNIECNLKDSISLLPQVDDEGNFPNREIPWLIDYIVSDKNQLVHKITSTNRVGYDGQKNVYKQYKGKTISAYITDADNINGPTFGNVFARGYILIGHPLIVNKELKKIVKQLTWTIETPYWEGISEKYFVFFRELNVARNIYYNFQYNTNAEWGERVRVKRYNAVSRSIPLVQFFELEKIKVISRPLPPEKNKECDCMSCDDKLAKLILSKVNTLSQKIDQMSVPLNTLNGAIQTDDEGNSKNIFQQLWDLFFPNRNKPREKPFSLQDLSDKINKLQDYLREKFYEADALLDKKMTDLDDFLGKDLFPMKVQPNLLSYYDDQPPEEIKNFAHLFAWYISQFDSLIGEFPIKIDIEDIDPSKEGNQTKSMEFVNISEILAEIMGLLTMDVVNSDILINMSTRIAAETVGAKNAALIAQDYAKANADYLGYKGNIKKRDIQYSFDVSDLNRLDKLLQNSEQRIMGWENEDKNSVADYLAKLMFAAQIIKAVHFKKSADGLINTAKNFTDEPIKDEDSEWTKFLHDINNPDSQFNINLDFPRPRIKDRKDGEDDQS